MTMITRRTLFRGTAGTLAGAMLARTAHATPTGHIAVAEFQELPTTSDERLRMLIATAVDVAMATGATYADARLTFSQKLEIKGDGRSASSRWGGGGRRSEGLHFGVRALYDGYWGFASSPVWTKDEAARLGRDVVADAKANVLGRSRAVEFAPNPNATSGDWSMPVTDDPFATNVDELFDYLSGLFRFIEHLQLEMHLGRITKLSVSGEFHRQQKAFGSSEGQFVTQRVYRTGGNVGFWVVDPDDRSRSLNGSLDQITGAGAGLGFEYLRHAQVRDWVRQLYTELEEERNMPIVPVDVGKYLTLIPAPGVAALVKPTVGIATEIDRVMGYEANATGTSYITDPDEMVGSLKIGTPAMQVTGTRASPGGLAHVKWDDEGVEPQDFTLIKDGVLTTLQTNREGAGWMPQAPQQPDHQLRSLGCAHGADASDPQVVHPADLSLHPDPVRDTTLDDLRSQIEKGIEFKTGGVSMDFQQSTGMMIAPAFKIEKGKRVARIAIPGLLFRTPELWGNLQALGGSGSIMRVGTQHGKGEPVQVGYSSVDAPPALFKEMSIVNPAQKA